ncbi:MAG: sigma-70 family RNA polymerase sigma factor [Pseudomonadota bacterium]
MTADRRSPPPELAEARARFLDLVGEIRPELHRYCARLTGSVIDGEDVVQDTLARAYYAISMAHEMPPLRPFLFRIAHNAAIDVLRRHDRKVVELVAEVPEDVADDDRPDPAVVRAALATFLTLPIGQRSAVILKDVLGCTLDEIVESTGSSLPAVKAALHRGRAALRARADLVSREEPAPASEPRPAQAPAEERALLHRYATLFNARDWDALRRFVAEDCQLDLVSRLERRGPGVGEYFTRYAELPDFRAVPGVLDDPATTGGRPALAIHEPRSSDRPRAFVLLDWRDGRVVQIRDFRYVPYIADEVVQGRALFRADIDDEETP